MGHEMVTGFQETEDLSKEEKTSKLEGGCCSKTVISTPEEFPSCSIDSENGSNESTSCVIDVNFEEIEMKEDERVCRICHLSSEESMKDSLMGEKKELICLGCSCKGGLSFAHLHCGEAWFKLKGNRKCEICGEIVNNIRGVGADKFMEEWIENGIGDNGIIGNEQNSERIREEMCWHGQPLCNFLMACLVIAFVLPWFFRINGRIW